MRNASTGSPLAAPAGDHAGPDASDTALLMLTFDSSTALFDGSAVERWSASSAALLEAAAPR
ncbi:hypothetical protein [Streptomyces sp. TRM75561]|uniref:hypothetical protein n=1 Tax=Streptomyces sp. TRM75561 TaxID=2975269 RepID=UPI0024471A35|nr:hypothetical protein [Streptomyces sp. TRM75561]MDH3039307.1 hypothetical protein [Streptomyces sp. TRM75561]